MVSYSTLLARKDFCCFLLTQLLGAFNDNFYKMVVSLLVVDGALTGEPLSITAIVFILPSLLFSGYAGFLADRYSKRNVLIVTKSCEIIAMLLAFIALGSGSAFIMLAVLFVLATQTAFFSPAKYGILPEIVSSAELSRANGLLQMTTYLAILLGGVFGGLLLSFWGDALYKISAVLVLIACVGTLASFGIARVESASTRAASKNPWGEIKQGIKQFYKQPLLFWVTMAISYFWGLGLAMQVNVVAYGYFTLSWGPLAIALMQAILGVGIAIGSLLAGRMSGEQIEPGLIPLGAILMGFGLLFLAQTSSAAMMIYLWLGFVGMAAGFYIVPLNALLQELPKDNQKGRMIATANFFNGIAMLVAGATTWVLYTLLSFTPAQVFTTFGVFTLLLSLLAIKVFPDFFLRFLTFLITHTLYRVRVIGYSNVPTTGPVLLVCNHVSYVDGMILSGTIPRFIRYLVLKDFYEHKLLHWLFKLAHAVPVKEGEYAMTVAAFEQARTALKEGHMVCIFAEGAITRTGQLLPFRKGFERFMQDLPDVPIVPVYLDGLWNSIFAYRDGRVLWKLPKHFPVRVSISFGKPLPGNSKAPAVRQAVQELGAISKFCTKDEHDTLSKRLLRTARRRYFKFCMVDAKTYRLSYGACIGQALVLSRYLRHHYKETKIIGVHMPASVAAALTNMAITLAGKTAINFSGAGRSQDAAYFMHDAKITVIIASREHMPSIEETTPNIIYYEDLCAQFNSRQTLRARLAVLSLPLSFVLRYYGNSKVTTDTTAAVCFSHGVKAATHGAMLSHNSVLANVINHSSVLHLKKIDRMMAVLPFSSAYGYSCNLWLSLINGMGVVFYPDPARDCDAFGRLMSQYKTSVIFDTIEHYQAYLNDVRASRFSYIRCAVVAGEGLPDEFADAFMEKFGLELLDSYGCVEMGPGIAINVPDIRRPGRIQRGTKAGSVGHPLPGVAVRVVDVATGKPVENGVEGLLLVRGLGLMQGYFDAEEVTHTVFRDGWYITGDLVILDNDGFLFYRGRA